MLKSRKYNLLVILGGTAPDLGDGDSSREGWHVFVGSGAIFAFGDNRFNTFFVANVDHCRFVTVGLVLAIADPDFQHAQLGMSQVDVDAHVL